MSQPPIETVAPEIQPSYPHMLPGDVAIWHSFLCKDPILRVPVAYDVHVGTPAHIPENFEPPYRYMIERLSTKRIDVVIFFPKETVVCEIKPYAGLTAIGQALCYSALFKRDFPQYPNVKPCIITDTAQIDTPHLCALNKVVLVETDLH
jgi:hypothetical protein